ncbi:hypothetical protein ILUMI_19130 [Ignelater luminosus]|uniref:Retrotransposon gag domain-containing protein n=1 Tax=Ignelater luminosus TaxID=2038154 RepID=A0A8K0CM99_IGNLU|nr:hypothetical protein ILUMI_19130 [Ignelater luminosus]
MMQHFTIQNQTAQSTPVHYNVSRFHNFDKSKETFQQYKERFDNFLSMKGLTSDKNTSKTILLNRIGPEYFELLKLSVAPKEIGTLSFDEVIKSLDEQLTEKKNALVERHKFLSETQGANQSIQDFVTKLCKFIPACQFKCDCGQSVADLFLHSQFIKGLSNQSIRHQLLLESTQKFSEAVLKAQTLEASTLANQQFESPSENAPASINSF